MFDYGYECLNGHPVLPGGKFCMHCGSRVASGAAVRTAKVQARRPIVQEIPDGYAVVPEGYKLVALPTAESTDAQALTVVEPEVTEVVAEAPVVEETPAAEATEANEVNGISIDDDLAAWLNDAQDGWRMPEYEIAEPEVAEEKPAAKPVAQGECPSSLGRGSIGVSVFPFFPFGGMITIGGGSLAGSTTSSTARPVARRRTGLGFMLFPMVMFMLLSMLGSAFSGPNTNVMMVPGGVVMSNTIPGTGNTGVGGTVGE